MNNLAAFALAACIIILGLLAITEPDPCPPVATHATVKQIADAYEAGFEAGQAYASDTQQ